MNSVSDGRRPLIFSARQRCCLRTARSTSSERKSRWFAT